MPIYCHGGADDVNSRDCCAVTNCGVTLTGPRGQPSGMPKKDLPSEIDRMAGLRLKAVREVLGMTQESLAHVLGVTRTALANWEGGRLPDVRAMVRLSQKFQIPLDWIYAGALGHVPYDLAAQLEARCAEIGAVVGGPVAEWPAAPHARNGAMPAGTPPRRSGGRTLHERLRAPERRPP